MTSAGLTAQRGWGARGLMALAGLGWAMGLAQAQPIRPPGPLPLPPHEGKGGARIAVPADGPAAGRVPLDSPQWRPDPTLLVPQAIARPMQPSAPLPPDELRLTQLYEQAAPAVAAISVELLQTRADGLVERHQGAGSGVLWDAQGHVVTSLHVVMNAQRIMVQLGDAPARPAQVVGRSLAYDVAVLSVPLWGAKDSPTSEHDAAGAAQLPQPVPLGDSRTLRVGQRVWAIGSPFGLKRTLTQGVVSGLDRDLSAGRTALHNLIQTDAAIQAGSSGGALLDSAGNLVGMHMAMQTPQTGFAGVGFALPSHLLQRVVTQILATGQADVPSLGFVPMPTEAALRLGLRGVLVQSVTLQRGKSSDTPSTSASRASPAWLPYDPITGEVGDRVVAINGKPVSSYAAVADEIERAGVWSLVKLTVLRHSRHARPVSRTVEVRVSDQALDRLPSEGQ